MLLPGMSSTQTWSDMSQSKLPDMQEEALPVDELHSARLALDAASCYVYNVSHSYLLPCGILCSSTGSFRGCAPIIAYCAAVRCSTDLAHAS